MRNALMVSQTEFPKKNIGDYVQAIAARQFSPDALFVQREHLHDYDGEPVRMIMNGWFMIHPEQFPPSDKIHPLYISFHMNPTNAEKMLAQGGFEHLKAHEPIGCRDFGTEALLKSKGISAYFSGCLTLTLGRIYSHDTSCGHVRKGVYFVDPAFDYRVGGKHYWAKLFIHSAKTLLCKPKLIGGLCRKITSISWNEHWERISGLKRFFLTLDFYDKYSKIFGDEILRDAEFIPQHIRQNAFKDEDAKFAFADKLLRKYANAKLVVTGRIHAALPCTSMGTPVVFTNLERQNSGNASSIGRLDGLLQFFNVVDMEGGHMTAKFAFDSEDGKIHKGTPIPKNELWRPYADDMAEKAKRFMMEE